MTGHRRAAQRWSETPSCCSTLGGMYISLHRVTTITSRLARFSLTPLNYERVSPKPSVLTVQVSLKYRCVHRHSPARSPAGKPTQARNSELLDKGRELASTLLMPFFWSIRTNPRLPWIDRFLVSRLLASRVGIMLEKKRAHNPHCCITYYIGELFRRGQINFAGGRTKTRPSVKCDFPVTDTVVSLFPPL